MVQTSSKIKNLIDDSVVIFSVGSVFHCSDGNDYTVKQYEFDTKYEKNFGELIITFDKTITTDIYKKDGVKFYVVSITNPDGSVYSGKPNLYYTKNELKVLQEKAYKESHPVQKSVQQEKQTEPTDYAKNLTELANYLGVVIIHIEDSLHQINDKIEGLSKQLQKANSQDEKIIDDPIKVLNSIVSEIQRKQKKHEDEFTKFKNDITTRINGLEEQINNIKVKKPQKLFE